MSDLEALNAARAKHLGQPVPTGREKKDDPKGVIDILRGALSDSGVGSFVEGAAKAATFGTNDEIKAALYSAFSPKSYGEELSGIREEDKGRAEDYTGANIAGQVGGSLLSAAALPTSGAATLMGAVGKGALSGAAGGAAQGFGEGEGGLGNRSKALVDGALWGGTFGGGLSAAGRGAKTLVSKAKKTGSHLPALKSASDSAYKAVADSGIVMPPDTLKDMIGNIKTNISQDTFFDPRTDPTDKMIHGMVTKLENIMVPSTRKGANKMITAGRPPADSVMQLAQMDTIRKDAWKRFNRTNDPRILDIINGIDDAIDSLPEGNKLLDDARKKYASFKQAQMIEHVMDKGELNDKAWNSYNVGQKYRSALANIISDPKKAKGFLPEQLEDMRKIVDGNLPEKILETIGKGAPTGSGLRQNMIMIGSFFHPAVAATAAGSMAANVAANLHTKGQMQSLLDNIAGHTKPPITSQMGPTATAAARQGGAAMPSLMNLIMPEAATEQEGGGELDLLNMMMQRKLQQ